jgi:hypothetical protein
MVAIDYLEAYSVVKPLIIFVLAMSLYAIFIFKFYRFLAKRNIIEFKLSQYNRANHWALKTVFGLIFYLVEYVMLLPIFIFFWFGFLATLLVFLAKNQPIENILLVAIAVVGAVRVTAYYNEDLSKDLAKMLPFALLGVLLVDISFFNLAESITMLKTVTNHIALLLYYLGFIVLLEIILRIIYLISYPFTTETKVETKEEQYS